MPKVATADLTAREYWTPAQAARVLGHGAAFWRAAFDRGAVEGQLAGDRRYLVAGSARVYLNGLCRASALAKPLQTRGEAAVARFMAKHGARPVSTN